MSDSVSGPRGQENRIKPGRLSLPMMSEELFGRPGPFVIEAGFGDGRYLSFLGKEHPEWNILGVEVSLGSLWRAWRRMKRDETVNVRLYRGDVRFIVRDVVAPASLAKLYINFPDPWPRRRHAGHRLLQAPFFRLLSTRLVDGGSALLTTDHSGYFEFATAEAESTGLFEVRRGPPPPATLETKYALKWREQNKQIFHAEFLRIAEDASHPRSIEKIEMQHATMSGRLQEVGPFEKQVCAFEGGHAIILEAYRELSGDGLLFKCIIEEADLHQELLVQAWQREEGNVFISMQSFGDPLATRGAREAVRGVVAWLETQGLETSGTWI